MNESCKIKKAKNISILVILFFIISFNFSLAVTTVDFTCSEYNYPWCGTETLGGSSGLVSKLYNYSLALVGVTALGAIIYGGILYTVSSGNASKQSEAVSWITGAVWGIVLLIGASLLLRTINPEILQLREPEFVKPVIKTATKQAAASRAYYSKHPEYLNKATDKSNWTDLEKSLFYSHDEAYQALKAAGIPVVGTNGLCPNQASNNCTSLNGIPKDTINTLIKIRKDLENSANPVDRAIAREIVITGGSEQGHVSQGFGMGSVDLNYSAGLYNYIYNNMAQYKGGTGSMAIIKECVAGENYCPSHATGPHLSFYFR
ncbi:MAG: hypothetical protein AAB596_00095 [Patescibacteria group bacterium]